MESSCFEGVFVKGGAPLKVWASVAQATNGRGVAIRRDADWFLIPSPYLYDDVFTGPVEEGLVTMDRMNELDAVWIEKIGLPELTEAERELFHDGTVKLACALSLTTAAPTVASATNEDASIMVAFANGRVQAVHVSPLADDCDDFTLRWWGADGGKWEPANSLRKEFIACMSKMEDDMGRNPYTLFGSVPRLSSILAPNHPENPLLSAEECNAIVSQAAPDEARRALYHNEGWETVFRPTVVL